MAPSIVDVVGLPAATSKSTTSVISGPSACSGVSTMVVAVSSALSALSLPVSAARLPSVAGFTMGIAPVKVELSRTATPPTRVTSLVRPASSLAPSALVAERTVFGDSFSTSPSDRGPVRVAPSTSIFGTSLSSHFGIHQALSPSRVIIAGVRVIRTTNASTSTPNARPKPMGRAAASSAKINPPNTEIIMIMAAITTRTAWL